jgi:hypothetical protein
MIGRDQHAGAGRRQIFQSANFGAEQGAEQQRAEIAHAFLAPFAEHEPHRAEARDRKAEEDPAQRKTTGLQHRDEDRAHHHEGRLQHIAGGNHAGALGGRRPGLDCGEGRHHEQSAAEGKHREVGQHPHSRERSCEGRGGDVGAAHGLRDRPGEIEADNAHDDGADRHQRQIGADVTELRREQGADRDADGEHCETKRHHALAAANDVLDQCRQQRKHDRADQPEPGDDDHAIPKPRLAIERLQQADGRGPWIRRDGEVRGGGGRRRNARGKGPGE